MENGTINDVTAKLLAGFDEKCKQLNELHTNIAVHKEILLSTGIAPEIVNKIMKGISLGFVPSSEPTVHTDCIIDVKTNEEIELDTIKYDDTIVHGVFSYRTDNTLPYALNSPGLSAAMLNKNRSTYLKVSEVSAVLGVSQHKIRKWLRENKMAGFKARFLNLWFVPRTEVERIIGII
ncbi:excisionase family DNA binding protein [Methanococcus maripaludis]|uniref:Excisionase family DNA binding protein n=1 Tax=Methanococcus maripaludis TaxID=39152 RepID=A0A7J9NVV3_METMI|nr:helix-turn-helix domain-containing protein [Methanococcus maripaludis]MBA2851818.1 excisionase family DNA binding protein [Methanococcus maripaludis]